MRALESETPSGRMRVVEAETPNGRVRALDAESQARPIESSKFEGPEARTNFFPFGTAPSDLDTRIEPISDGPVTESTFALSTLIDDRKISRRAVCQVMLIKPAQMTHPHDPAADLLCSSMAPLESEAPKRGLLFPLT